jgi:5-methylcytosine-specific restriction endonuclease McrA
MKEQGMCLFCGTIYNLEKHHIIQKRFGGSNDPKNIVLLCPNCHRMYHFLTDILLDYLLLTNRIKKHQIRK